MFLFSVDIYWVRRGKVWKSSAFIFQLPHTVIKQSTYCVFIFQHHLWYDLTFFQFPVAIHSSSTSEHVLAFPFLAFLSLPQLSFIFFPFILEFFNSFIQLNVIWKKNVIWVLWRLYFTFYVPYLEFYIVTPLYLHFDLSFPFRKSGSNLSRHKLTPPNNF